jgi:hypothetical protein
VRAARVLGTPWFEEAEREGLQQRVAARKAAAKKRAIARRRGAEKYRLSTPKGFCGG